jgi:hypothetical protein
LTEEEVKRLKVLRYKLQNSLLFFTRYFYKNRYGRKFIVSEHHNIICDALEKVLRGEITKLIINISPRYGKTELAVKNFIAHGLALNPAAKFIHLTYAANLALDNSEEAKDIVTSEDYQKLFPVNIKKDSNSKAKWYTDSGGGVYAAAAAGQVTGFGAGKMDEEEQDLLAELEVFQLEAKKEFAGAIIIDDPIKPDDAMSIIKRTRINDRFESTIRNRVNSRKTPIIVIQQRVHEHDLSGYLMAVEPGQWTVVKLPALKEDGTALWDLKHTAEELQAISRINAYVFQAQYQQDPKPLKSGGEFWKQFNIEQHVTTLKWDESVPLHISWDENVYPYLTCQVWQIVREGEIKVLQQIDEICLSDPRNRPRYTCAEFKKRYPPEKVTKLYIYGDATSKKEDVKQEKGENLYTEIENHLREYEPVRRVPKSNPSVIESGAFIDKIYSDMVPGLRIEIGANCIKSIHDYAYAKEDSDGTILKKKVTDPLTKISYEEYGHCSDAKRYFICEAENPSYLRHKGANKISPPVMGGREQNDRNSY